MSSFQWHLLSCLPERIPVKWLKKHSFPPFFELSCTPRPVTNSLHLPLFINLAPSLRQQVLRIHPLSWVARGGSPKFASQIKPSSPWLLLKFCHTGKSSDEYCLVLRRLVWRRVHTDSENLYTLIAAGMAAARHHCDFFEVTGSSRGTASLARAISCGVRTLWPKVHIAHWQNQPRCHWRASRSLCLDLKVRWTGETCIDQRWDSNVGSVWTLADLSQMCWTKGPSAR